MPRRYTSNRLNQITATAGSGAIRFEGSLNEAGTVAVGGQAAVVAGDNTFSVDIPLNSGTPVVAVTATDTNSNVTTQNYAVPVSGVGSRSFTYDLNGNTLSDGVRTCTWDAADRIKTITQSGNTSEFVYDGLGRRVAEKVNSTLVKRWVWEGLSIAEERDAGNTVTKRFYGLGFQSGSDEFYYTKDHLGSIREVVDGTGAVRARYDYTLYGAATKLSGDIDADFLYTGHYRHAASGLYLAPYRAYDAELGRWLSRDPIEERDGANLYRYVANNPTNLVDPSGLFAPAPVLIAVPPAIVAPAWVGAAITVGIVGYAGYGYYQLGNAIGDLFAPGPEDFHGPRVQGAMPPPRPPGPPRGGTAASCPNPPNGENEYTASGREAHKWWQPPAGYRTDFQFSNGLKPDAINFQTRNILELKPNNPQAIQQGMRQIQQYIKAAQAQFGGTWTGQVVPR